MSDFSPESIARIQRVVPYVERSMKNTLPRRARWHGKGSPEIAFELKDALTPGGNATAHPMTWNGSAWTVDTATASEIEVYDVLGIFRGRAKDAYTSPHNQGSRGIARRFSPRGEYRIVQMTPHALVIHGQLTAALATTDATFTIDGVQVMQPIGGIITTTDPAGNVTITNRLAHEGDDNGECTAAWDEYNDVYYAVQTECPA